MMENVNLGEMMRNSQQVETAWNRTSVKKADKRLTFGNLLESLRMENKLCCNARERMESEIADIKATFAPALAAEKAAAARNTCNDFVQAHKQQVSARLDEICKAKMAEVDRLISRTGDRDLMELVKGLSLRSSVSDREWSAVTVRVTESGDYQAMQLLAEVAEKLNRYYKPPFNPEEAISEIEKAKADLSHVIDILDKPEKDWTLSEMTVLGEYDHLTTNQDRFRRLDSENGIAVPEKQQSLIDRLKDARELAFKNADLPTANAISRFIYNNVQYIDDRETIAGYVRGEAESLIQQAHDNAGVPVQR